MSQPYVDPNAGNTAIFLRMKGREREVTGTVPAGFWKLLPKDRVAYIAQQWPGVEWAGNGDPNPLTSCSHFFR